MSSAHTKKITRPTPPWYDAKRAQEILDAYNRGAGSAQPADEFAARSVLPAGTGSQRDFSYIAPDIPLFIAPNCVGCMECVNNCPDTAILGKALTEGTIDAELSKTPDEKTRAFLKEQFVVTTKYHTTYEKKRAKDPSAPPGALFGIFVDPTKCKGCGECVEVCGDHRALQMIKKTPENLPRFFTIWDFHNALPPTPDAYINPKVVVDLMLRESNNQYMGGGGSCMGCGEASVIRQLLTMTAEKVGADYGIVAATGCNTVYGSTYPYNPFVVPWANSLFENVATFAMGVRQFWNQTGHKDRVLWTFGGDGAMVDIGFQALSRLLASGQNVKVLILDTQVYSNTGGQTSTATYIGQEAKMSVHGKVVPGKTERRKEVGLICMMHPRTFVAQVVGPMTGHFYKAVARALEFDGPAVINAYTTCQPEHGVADDMSAAQARLAVESRAFPIFVYDPDAGETLRERLSLQGNPSVDRDWHARKAKDGGIETVDFASWARTEGRFRKHFDKNGNPSETLLRSQAERLENWRLLQEMAGIVNKDRASRKSPDLQAAGA
ncbi:MAG: 4Fe-4S dicluster domain-containing protein [Nitrospirae bacterium]|nr:4Fe-4S dicluster domain-containing protein [Nitrospirota bacterium]